MICRRYDKETTMLRCVLLALAVLAAIGGAASYVILTAPPAAADGWGNGRARVP
jgi:hypothetical protein